jgi:hypothetical protein
MSVISTIAVQRQMLLDGIDANEGDINLRIFEDFYPDEAHFIYELLQNAEDAEATEVFFELSPHSCAFEHNGARHFNERDIRGITGIFNSSKKDNQDKIGKFGVGFKSVFVYTDSPIVYSRDYNFKILKLVLPEEIAAMPGLGQKTRFEIPFNNPKKSAEHSFAEVKAGLEQLSETTLLFLNNLRDISWKIGTLEGAVSREEHSEAHVEILKQIGHADVISSHWLRFSAPIENVDRFSAPVEGVERQKVSAAYELARIGDTKSFDKNIPLSKQYKIIPAVKGKVSVFFPAEKETSGLRFHLHGPFVPELSRASIKDSPENLPLFAQLAAVAARSLYSIKELGLLTGEFLSVLPNNDDPLPKRYESIRNAVLNEMQTHSLVPTYTGGFYPAKKLLQARATLKTLLPKEDLAFVTGRNDGPEWAIGATQKNSNQDRFLSSLNIRSWEEENLKEFFELRARENEYEWEDNELDPLVNVWLINKSVDWFQALYSILYKHCEDTSDYGYLESVYFLKLASGKIGNGNKAYFQTGPTIVSEPHDRVDDSIFTVGAKKQQQVEARIFLENIGVRAPNETDELTILLKSRYGQEGEPPSDEVYLEDLKRMVELSEKNPYIKSIFTDAYIFKVNSPDFLWSPAANIYIDAPFARTDLKVLHESAPDQNNRRWPLDFWYITCGIPIEKIVQFASYVGCEKNFEKLYVTASCVQNPNWGYLRSAPGERFGNNINRDFALTAEAKTLLNVRTTNAALLIWTALCQSESVRPSILKACYQYSVKGGPHYSESQLIYSLRELEWVPLSDGSFVKPRAAVSSSLPKGYIFDAGYKWLQAVGFGTEEKKRTIESAERVTRRAQLGFKSEDELQRALEFTKLPEKEQQRILTETAERNLAPVELPERPLRNAELRKKRIAEEATNSPEKEAVSLQRSVQLGVAAAKVEAKLYLTDQYTNNHGQMICQVCKDELPFKLPNGAYYFEAIEVVTESSKRFREGFLALCPNHAAAYQYANAQKNSILELVVTASGNEIEVALGGEEVTIYFTEVHLADVKACFETYAE